MHGFVRRRVHVIGISFFGDGFFCVFFAGAPGELVFFAFKRRLDEL
jgi:hypothetical protein